MSYPVAVGIYLFFYVMGLTVPLSFGGTGSVIRLVIFSIPILLVMPRVAQRFTDGQPLLPDLLRRDGGLLYGGAIALIWIGHLIFFGGLAAVFVGALFRVVGLPIGIFMSFALYPYLVGIVLMEIAFRFWSNRQTEYLWKRQQKAVYIVVGLIVAVQVGFNLTSDRPVDLLNYDEREALALGRGYAREVQRVVTRVYVDEDRIPCASEGFLDPNSFLRSANRDLRKMLSIELLECGQFVVTIHESIDGVPDGQLLYVATPGDADAGTPLDWQCFSAHHARIERHTNGGCTYDQSLAGTLPEPADPPLLISDTPRALALTSPSVAPVPRQPPGLEAVSGLGSPQASKPQESGSSIQAHLDRLVEPALWENCGDETTSYRMVKFDDSQYLAAVRISHDSQSGAFKSITSSTPGQSIGADGYVDDRTWGRLAASVDAAGFWNLQSDRDARGPEGGRIYIEGCRNGSYHSVQRGSDDPEFAQVAQIFAAVGKLAWLEN